MRTWEIERMFKEDIREKKKTASGAFHMRGKGVKHGFSGALRTPYHFMKEKERKKLSGEVKVYNMFTTILDWNQFSVKDTNTQKELLTKWREIYKNDEIMEQLGVGRPSRFNNQSFANLCNDLGVPKKAKGRMASPNPKPKEKMVAISSQSAPVYQLPEKQKVQEVQKEPVQVLITNGLHLEYNGKYDVDALGRLFEKLQLLLDGEKNQYQISLSLSEVPE